MVKAGAGNIVAYVANNPNARYVVAALVRSRMAAATRSHYTPPTTSMRLCTKRFTITERIKWISAGSILNVLNHAQYTGGYISDVNVEWLYRQPQRPDSQQPSIRPLRPVLQQ